MSSYHAKQTLRRDGVDVALYRFDSGEQTSRGRQTVMAESSPKSIKAIPDPGGKSLSYGQWGVKVEADMVYLAHEDEEIDDGGGDGASRIVQNGDVFVVIDADSTLMHGFQVLECERDGELTAADLEEEAAAGGDGS
ncbi:head closure protein, type 1 [Halobacterium phage ChaoS9]|uniref:Head closure protein, type 1 n=1 Tax=Halobacterium phage ChaoS9 TaxID=2847105 RepID=A0A481V893_9CAUD|nr:head closure protein, type 1 [Halobacterium phage ChaoS9]QBI90018.1 head closure protein, type 1 [Halobacterium phage ChaoS9]